jgi:hypothetical protein
MGLPPEILPVMGEHTLVPLVVVLIVGAPYCFEVEHVEIDIELKLVYQLYRDLRI